MGVESAFGTTFPHFPRVLASDVLPAPDCTAGGVWARRSRDREGMKKVWASVAGTAVSPGPGTWQGLSDSIKPLHVLREVKYWQADC